MRLSQEEVGKFVLDDLANLKHYLEIPGIAAEHRGIDETVAWLVNTFRSLGASTVETWDQFGGNPVVFAEFNAHQQQTVLFYNHYDVQPAGDTSRG